MYTRPISNKPIHPVHRNSTVSRAGRCCRLHRINHREAVPDPRASSPASPARGRPGPAEEEIAAGGGGLLGSNGSGRWRRRAPTGLSALTRWRHKT
uniref:Uncharacterized protein n=1 Tax=Arundo donax TaxID=35708 RepID=A0A0A8ZCP2_ARUDO